MYSEDSEVPTTSLSQSARQNFVTKVYSVLSVQLTVTCFMVFLNMNYRSFQVFQIRNNWAFWLALIGSIVTHITLFVGKISKTFPTNFIVMGAFTLCESYLVSYITSMYTPDNVMLCVVATLAATLGLTYLAMTTTQNFTSLASGTKGFMYSLSWTILSVSIINLLFLRSNIVFMGIAITFAAIYSINILIHTQLILGGRNKELTHDDYVLGSTILYNDIISLFLNILQILGKKKDD